MQKSTHEHSVSAVSLHNVGNERRTDLPPCAAGKRAPRQATGYKERWPRSASSSSARTAVGSRPICAPMRSTATDRICWPPPCLAVLRDRLVILPDKLDQADDAHIERGQVLGGNPVLKDGLAADLAATSACRLFAGPPMPRWRARIPRICMQSAHRANARICRQWRGQAGLAGDDDGSVFSC